MASVGVDLVNQLAILSVGRRLTWTKLDTSVPFDFGDADGIPTDVGDGTAVIGIVAFRAGIQARPGRVVDLRVTTLDLTATYTVTLTSADGGTVPPITYDAAAGGAADLEDVVDGIAAAANAAIGGPFATSYALSPSTTRNRVRFHAPNPGGYGFDATATGTAALAADADGYWIAIPWIKFGGEGADRPDAGEWFVPQPVDGGDDAQDFVPRARRFVVSGAARAGVSFGPRGTDDTGKMSGDGSVVTIRKPTIWIGLAKPEEPDAQ